MVLTVFTALISPVGAKVKHIPHMGGPEVLAGEQLPDQLLVVICLIFFHIIPLFWVGRMPIQSLAAVLAASNGDVGIYRMKVIEPGAVHGRIAAVPAKIVVVGNGIRNLKVRAHMLTAATTVERVGSSRWHKSLSSR